MVNYHDPAVVEKDFRAYIFTAWVRVARRQSESFALAVAVVKLWYTVDGLYMWVWRSARVAPTMYMPDMALTQFDIFQLGVLQSSWV
jgi:hypothetical protein